MIVSQNYGVLRVMYVHLPAHRTKRPDKYPVGWLPEERLVYLLTGRETTIGRALSNDLILMDPTVSRMHARLLFNDDGWTVQNATEQNVLYVNGQLVAPNTSHCLQSQDFLVLGNTILQLIAPKNGVESSLPEIEMEKVMEQLLALPPFSQTGPAQSEGKPISTQEKSSALTPLPPVAPEAFAWLNAASEQSVLPATGSAWTATPAPLEAAETPSWAEKLKVSGDTIPLHFVWPYILKRRIGWAIGGIALLVLVLVALLSIISNNLPGIVALFQEGPLTILSVLTIPIVAALGISLLVDFIDRYEREPWFLRFAAFLWGAIIAIPPTTFIEGQVDAWRSTLLGPQAGKAFHALFSALNAGITEETFKGLGLFLLFMLLHDEFDNVTDGIVYGALIGAGFAMVENIIYFAGNPKAFLFLLIGRIVLGWLSHSTFTVCLGMALGYIRHTRVRWQHIVIPVLGYLASVSLHTIFDFINFFANSLILTAPATTNIVLFSFMASIGDYLPPCIAQLIIIYCLIKSLAHEAVIIREFLASEVSAGIVTVDEYALLQHSFLRTKTERRVLLRHGVRRWLYVKALYQTEIGLAFRKWHVSMGDKPKPGPVQPEDAYRQRIRYLRQEIVLAEKKAGMKAQKSAG